MFGKKANNNLKYSLLIAGVFLLAVLVVTGTVALMILSSYDEENIRRQGFDLSTSVFLNGLENVFRRWNRTLLKLRAVAELSYSPHSQASSLLEEPLTTRQWELYLQGITDQDPATTSIFTGWTAKVTSDHREEFLESTRDFYKNPNLMMVEVSDDGVVQEAASRPVYFPFALMWPWQEERPRVLDLASEAKRKAILELSFQEDRTTLSDPITFLDNSTGVYMLLPTFDISQFPAMDQRNVSFACNGNLSEPLSCHALLGFVTLLVKFDAAVEEAAELSIPDASVKVLDLAVNEVLVAYQTCDHPKSSDLKLRHVLHINNKDWQVDIRQCGNEKDAYSRYKWFILASAIMLSVMIVVTLFLLKKNTEKAITAQRAFRTAEAERENEERNRLLAEEERMEADAARARAEEMSKAKARFLNNMNRELRTPLSGVVGTIDILQHALPKEVLDDHAEDFQTISNCAEVLLSTVNDILDINKLMAGKLKLHYTFFLVRDAVQSCISTVRVAAAKKNITIIMKMPTSLRGILTDQARFSQVVLNYLSNAVKFTPEDGKITILLAWGQLEENPFKRLPSTSGDIGMRKEDLKDLQDACSSLRRHALEEQSVVSHREQMILCVEDSGIGIAEDKIARLFQPFEQADASVTRAYGGTGLGLSICRQLAQLLGGSVWVESTIGVGSKFYLSLPMDVIEEVDMTRLTSQGKGLEGSRNKKFLTMASSSGKCSKQESISDPYYHRGLTQTAQQSQEEILRPENIKGSGVETDSLKGEKTSSPTSPEVDRDCGVLSGTKTERKTGQRRESHQRFAGKKVLVVEDNLLNQRVFIKYLRSVGVEVEVANNGLLGVKAAKKEKYDLILMDCHMPLMDGYLASKQITEDERCVNKLTPIVALTADVEPSNKKMCEESGMVDFLTKPLQSNTLYSVMGRYISS